MRNNQVILSKLKSINPSVPLVIRNTDKAETRRRDSELRKLGDNLSEDESIPEMILRMQKQFKHFGTPIKDIIKSLSVEFHCMMV